MSGKKAIRTFGSSASETTPRLSNINPFTSKIAKSENGTSLITNFFSPNLTPKRSLNEGGSSSPSSHSKKKKNRESSNDSSAEPTAKLNVSQATLDFGQNTLSNCPECGMVFDKTSVDDKTLHNSFHSSIYSLNPSKYINAGILIKISENIVCYSVCDNSKSSLEEKLNGLISRVNSEMAAVDFAIEDLKEKAFDCKIFLFIEKNECIGLLIAETLQPLTHKISGILNKEISEEQPTASVGIVRIWSHSNHRRKAIASKLLNSLFGAF